MVKKWKTITENLTISECLDFASKDLLELAEEMDEWRSNMEGTNLEYTQKYEDVSECADILEEQASSLEDIVANMENVEHFNLNKSVTAMYSKPYSKRESRSTRLNRIIAYLEVAKDELNAQLDALREKIDELDALEMMTQEQEEEKEKLESDADTMEDQINEIDNVIHELEGVEFPSMY